MEKYKYKIGDLVTYSKAVRTEKECPTCHNVEVDYDEIPAEGKIDASQYDYVYRIANGFISENVEVLSTGEKVTTPYLKEVELNKRVAVYRIGEDWYTEEDLAPKK